jgi:hypothetical protein
MRGSSVVAKSLFLRATSMIPKKIPHFIEIERNSSAPRLGY